MSEEITMSIEDFEQMSKDNEQRIAEIKASSDFVREISDISRPGRQFLMKDRQIIKADNFLDISTVDSSDGVFKSSLTGTTYRVPKYNVLELDYETILDDLLQNARELSNAYGDQLSRNFKLSMGLIGSVALNCVLAVIIMVILLL